MLPRCSFSSRSVVDVQNGEHENSSVLWLTEIPLPSSQHLEETTDECSDHEIRPTSRDINDPDKSNKDIRNLDVGEYRPRNVTADIISQ